MKLMSDINIHFENKRASRIFFVFIWLMYALVYMTKNCFSGALSAIVEEGTLSLTEASWIIASFYIAYTPLQILGGIFADRISPEKLITIGLVGSAASNVVIFFNQNFYVMLISWVFSAIIQFALWPAVFKIVSSQLVRGDRAKMIFFMQFASAGGLIMAYGTSANLPSKISFKNHAYARKEKSRWSSQAGRISKENQELPSHVQRIRLYLCHG